MSKRISPLAGLRTAYAASGVILILIILFFMHTDHDINRMNIDFLGRCGIEVGNSPKEKVYLTIPDEFDAVFSAYNNIISEAGYDLAPHKGHNAIRYSYRVLNYPESDKSCITANIIVCDDRIAAADICSLGAGGFVIPVSENSESSQNADKTQTAAK